jgi:hypothetical protein
MTSLYFAYGANMHPESMKYRCPDAVPVGQFNLRDWQLEFYNHATIMPVQTNRCPECYGPSLRIVSTGWMPTKAIPHITPREIGTKMDLTFSFMK